MVPIVVLYGVCVSDFSGIDSTQSNTRSLNERIQSLNRSLNDGFKRSEQQTHRLEFLVKQLQQAGLTGKTIDELSQQCRDSRKILDLLIQTPIKEIDQKK